MASIQTVIRQTLEANASLTAILTGGIYDAAELGRQGLQPDQSGLYTNSVLNPCAVLRWRGANGYGDHYAPQSQRRFFEIYIYEDNGYSNIDNALRLIKQTLHRTRYTADNAGLCWVNWVQDSGEIDSPDLGNAALRFSRFELIFTEEL